MKYSFTIKGKILGVFFLLGVICSIANGQTTVVCTPTSSPNFWSASPSVLVFGIRNTNTYPIRITDLSNYCPSGHNKTYALWYHPTVTTGVPTSIDASNGWIEVISGINVSASSAGVIPIFSGLDLVIPPLTTYRLALAAEDGNGPYYGGSSTSSPTLFSDGGVEVYAQDNPISPTYAGLFPGPPTNTPRSFYGTITFEQAISAPNNAGIAGLVSPINFCVGVNPIAVEIVNSGNNLINNVDIHWSLNGIPQPTVNYNTPIDTAGSVSGNTATVNLGNHNFTNAPVDLMVYTSNPNGVADTVTGNDTLHITLQSSMSGVYTINSNGTTGGTNYASFAEFIDDLHTYGICGPVIANVDPASGPYNEILQFGTIVGSSPTNTIRINGNGRWVEYTNTTTTANNDRQMLTLSGTKYLTIDSLNFKTLGTVGWGALITAGAERDSIINCTFDMGSITTTASASSSGIVFSGSATSATATSGSASKYCYIGNNKIIGPTGTGGPYYAVALAGADSNTVQNNELQDFYMYGVYINGSAGSKILNNEIHRSTKTTVTTFYGVYSTGDTPGTIIDGNSIHTPGGLASSTSAVYGINLLGDATALAPTLVTNNIVYDINQGGTIYGLYLSAAPYTKMYHNTVTIDKVLSGTSVNRGVFFTGDNSGSELKNNIISITAGTGGIKTGMFFNVANSVDDAQRNNVYVNSSQSGNQFYAAYPAASTFATLSDFQTGYPTLEVGSLDVDPLFVDAQTGNLLPGAFQLASNGVDLQALVPTDILGNSRSVAPTPGAFEIPAVQGADGALVAFISPGAVFCEGTQEVKVSLANFGSLPISNFQINWEFNGVAQTTYTYAGTLDTLNGAGQNVDTVTIGTPNFLAGNNSVKVWLDVTNDQNPQNDTLLATFSPSVFTISAINDSVCISGDVSLSLSPSAGYSAGAITWESSPDGISYTPIAGANLPDLTEPAPATDYFYRVFINSGPNGCYSNEVEIIVLDPQIISTQDGVRCGTGTVDLSAVGSSGATLHWFATPTGGASLGTGSTFTTPSISATTNYYVSASIGSASEDVPSPTAGTSTFITTTVGWGLHFVVNNQTTITSVETYPVNTTAPGSAATIQIIISDISDVPLYQGPVHSFTASGTPTLEVVPVNISLPPGTYKMGMTYSGINNMVRESSGASYPYTAPSNALAITAGANGSGSASTSAAYYWFYNWKLGSGCESVRVPVEAEVIPAPSPQITPGGQAYFCENDSLSLSVVPQTGDTYQWFVDDNPIPGANGFVYMANQSGSYTVEVVNSFNCSEVSIPTVVNEVIPVATVTPGGSTTFCMGGQVSLAANTGTGYTYQWQLDGANVTSGGTSSSYTANASGDYTVITTVNGCSKESSPVAVTVNPLPPAGITPTNIFICDGETTDLTANTGTGYTYQWQESGQPIAGATGSTYGASTGGSYSVWVTDANSCSSLSNEAIVTIFSSPAPAINQNGLTLSTTIYSGYQWNLNGAPIPGANSQQYIVAQNGDYTVTVTDPNGCSGTSTSVSVHNVGISEYDNGSELSVFPNPASDQIQILAPYMVDVEVTSIDGKVLLREKNTNKVDISALADDVYLLRMKDAQGRLVGIRKIIKITK